MSLKIVEMMKDKASRLTPETRGYAAYGFIVPGREGFIMPAFVIQWLEKSGLPCFLVYHDFDTDPYGRAKPMHYHVMVLYDALKTAAPVFDLCKAVGGHGLEAISSPHAYARYLCHLDNPDKYQYSLKEVMCINGCVYEEFIK